MTMFYQLTSSHELFMNIHTVINVTDTQTYYDNMDSSFVVIKNNHTCTLFTITIRMKYFMGVGILPYYKHCIELHLYNYNTFHASFQSVYLYVCSFLLAEAITIRAINYNFETLTVQLG